MINSISQPASLKNVRNQQRLSGASSRTSIISTSRNNIVSEFSNKRKSLLATPSTKRQQIANASGNGFSGVSAAVPTNGSSNPRLSLSQQLTVPSSQSKDPRPLKDKNYQTLIQEAVHKYLLANKFELEMNHPLTTKTLKTPTQKDFVLIFQFLYLKIDPNYKFMRSIEYEVFLLLKTINYPYLDGINKSQISAVGGPHWPTFLGLLYWLVKLNIKLADFNGISLISPDDQLDQIFIDYIRKSYRAFINNEDDYSEYYNDMRNQFDSLSSEITESIEKLRSEKSELSTKLNDLNYTYQNILDGERKSKALESDLNKFKIYIEQIEERKSKWADVLAKISEEVRNCEASLKAIEEEKKEVRHSLAQKGLTPEEVDRLSNERDKLSKSIDQTNLKLEETRKMLLSKESEYQECLFSLENQIKQYNSIIYKIGSSIMDISDVTDLEIHLNDIDEKSAIKPDQLLHRPLKQEKISLLELRKHISSNIHRYQDESIKLQEGLEILAEKISSSKEEIETLEAKLSSNKSIYEELYETMNNENIMGLAEIEKLESSARDLRKEINENVAEIEKRSTSINIEYDQLVRKISSEREVLHSKVERMIDYIIGFKLNVQVSLEELEGFVIEEGESG